ncbi:quinone-dependent dihydroorotate dehydrogenase [Arenibaculum pallidiluteum]|uniref:quinone-dependent dihydroorotate dehydrogenase n=1 Tax=Arenibaculum pallidiluteum TaxID=2812559 RepID=UPI001A9733DF|nr:quinone-dependent dihydroorotate dehydrogenase [Arenibaculum pallidiluteum]
MIDLFPLAGRVLRALDPERAHLATIAMLRSGLVPAPRAMEDPRLRMRLWGLDFPNPVGLAAGFDKNAEVPDAMLRQGFGFVEIGSVTPRPQPGNPRPRVFRLPEQQALINRYGFNNEGLDAVAARMEARRGRGGIVGANLGKNKETAEAAEDYALGIRRLAPLADYLVVNVSSPNTPGLRALQGRAPLEDLLGRCLAARAAAGLDRPPPLLLKIAPDLTDEDRADIAAVALAAGIDGIVVSNTTLARPAGLPPEIAAQAGGLSGRPLMGPATAVLAGMWRLTGGRLPLLGVGGIASGDDAYAKIRAGASLVQLYTALVYQGPGLVRRIALRLLERLEADGFATLAEAVGADHRNAAAGGRGAARAGSGG